MVSGVGSVRMYVLTRPAELHVKTVKYFKSIERVQDEVERHHAELLAAKGEPPEGGDEEGHGQKRWRMG